eukprot:1156148-Pelagomonas_calceolata.AAC.5
MLAKSGALDVCKELKRTVLLNSAPVLTEAYPWLGSMFYCAAALHSERCYEQMLIWALFLVNAGPQSFWLHSRA